MNTIDLDNGTAKTEAIDQAKQTNNSEQPAGLNTYNAIAQDLKKAIESGDYCAGTFPSSRMLASRYAVSRSTILAAFGVLARQGLMTVSHGKAAKIIAINHHSSPEQDLTNELNRESREPETNLSFAPEEKEISSRDKEEDSPLYEKLSPHIPARKWFALISNQARKAHNQGGMPNSDAVLELKLALRNYFARQRQIRANLDQLFIFENLTVAMQALANIFSIKAESEILIDAPCLASTARQLSRFSNKIEAIDLDNHLLNQGSNQKPCSGRLLYTTPSTRLGCNRTLSKPSRQAIIDWAKRTSSYIIEHDRGHEFCSGLSTNPAIFAIDQSSTAVYLADFNSSLSLLTNLCVVIVPPPLANLMRRNHEFEQSSSTIFESTALTSMLNSGYLERHARKVGQLSMQNLAELKRLISENETSRSMATIRLVKSSKEAILEIAPGINCDFLDPAIASKLLTPTTKLFGFKQEQASTFIVAADFLNQTNRALLHACFANRSNSANQTNSQFYNPSLLAVATN